jgi:D-serine deaminase-like pyridoxal phosphate-dependent protein
MQRQLSGGGCNGVTCATAWEAQALANAGIDDILIANEIVDPFELGTLASVATRAKITVTVDDLAQVRLLDDILSVVRASVYALIDVDVGLKRCGTAADGPELIALAQAVHDSKTLILAGLLGYEGHAVLEPDRAERSMIVSQAADLLRLARNRLETNGFPCPVVSGGGTGTYDLSPDARVWTEIQAGSYVLMDATYDKLDLPFRPAVYCVGLLISRHGSRGVVNIGLKTLSVEYGMPRAVDPSISVLGLSDEHARVAFDNGSLHEVGERILLIPSHIDPTLNLHDSLFVWNENAELEEWPITPIRRRPFGTASVAGPVGS